MSVLPSPLADPPAAPPAARPPPGLDLSWDPPAAPVPAGALPPLLERALEVCPQAVSIVDVCAPDQPLVYVNHAFELLTGYTRDEVLGRNCRFLQADGADGPARQRIRDAVAAGDRVLATLSNVRKDGTRFVNALSLEPLRDAGGRLTHYVGLQIDIGQKDRRQGEPLAADHQRRDEPLSGVVMLQDRIELALTRAHTIGTRCALMLVEVAPLAHEHATPIQDLATVVGEAMAEVSTSLVLLDTDRLAVLVDPAPLAGELAELAHRAHAAITHHLRLRGDGRSHSIGVAMGPGDGESAQLLLLAARRALDRARLRSALGGLSFFANAQDALWLARRQLETDLADAVARHQFTLAYQPLVQLDSGRIVGFEALIRWNHPQRGAVAPDEFIPVAEASGMIDEIGTWVLDTALARLAAFDRVCARPVRMAVNVSASQLERPGFVDTVRALTERHAIQPARLELEITERTVTSADPATLQVLHALRQLGVTLAIDDFGTGYSNLQGLTQLPVDTLKIDRSLTREVIVNPAAASVSRMVCELGRALDLTVIVEGIETEGQLGHFRRAGHLLGQGWLFCRAVDGERAQALLQAGEPLAAPAPDDDQPHLLLLDDEPDVLAALHRALRREGWRVHAATSPRQALDVLAAHPVGVVVCDQRMPEMSGTRFLQQVRRHYPDTVRIVLSGYSDLASVTEAVNEGSIWKYISKPWDDDALREQIRGAFDEYDTRARHESERRDARDRHAELEAAIAQRDARLDGHTRALAAAHDALLHLPIPVVGIDATGMIVLSNPSADRLFNADLPLIGLDAADALPAPLARAEPAAAPASWLLDAQPHAVHVQPLPGDAGSRGRLLCLVPRAP